MMNYQDKDSQYSGLRLSLQSYPTPSQSQILSSVIFIHKREFLAHRMRFRRINNIIGISILAEGQPSYPHANPAQQQSTHPVARPALACERWWASSGTTALWLPHAGLHGPKPGRR